RIERRAVRLGRPAHGTHDCMRVDTMTIEHDTEGDTMTLPTHDSIRDLARKSMHGCGLDLDAVATGTATSGTGASGTGVQLRSPITGQELGRVPADTPESAAEKI